MGYTNRKLPTTNRGGQPPQKSFANNKGKQKKFLQILEDTFNLTAAAKAVKVAPSTVYALMDRDPEFAEKVNAARDAACGVAEGEAFRRGVTGFEEPVFHHGQQVGTITRYSDRLLELVLSANSERYQKKSSVDITATATIEVSQAKTKLLSLLGVESLDDIEDAVED